MDIFLFLLVILVPSGLAKPDPKPFLSLIAGCNVDQSYVCEFNCVASTCKNYEDDSIRKCSHNYFTFFRNLATCAIGGRSICICMFDKVQNTKINQCVKTEDCQKTLKKPQKNNNNKKHVEKDQGTNDDAADDNDEPAEENSEEDAD